MKKGASLETVKGFLQTNKEFLREKFGVRDIGVFGSLARGEETLASDVDVLVDFEGSHETFRNYMALKSFLEDAFGAKVDLVITGTIKPIIRDEVLRDAVYA